MNNTAMNVSQPSQKHYSEIDVCRGLGIVLVVLGHAMKQTGETNGWFDMLLSVIYSFHMPLFFILSGFVSVKILSFDQWLQRWEYMKGRAFRLLIPYFAVGLLYTPLKFFLSRYAVKPYDFSSMWRLFLGENPDVALWFLYILFFSTLISVLVLREKSLTFLLVISFAFSAAACCMGWSARLPKYCFFFILGIYIRKNYDKFQPILEKMGTTLGALVIFAAANAALVTPGLSEMAVLWELTALSGSVLSLQLALLICRRKNRAFRLFHFLGEYSMDIYILSEPFNTAAKILFWSILHVNYLLCTLLCFIVGIVFPIPVSKYIVRKVKLFRVAILGMR